MYICSLQRFGANEVRDSGYLRRLRRVAFEGNGRYDIMMHANKGLQLRESTIRTLERKYHAGKILEKKYQPTCLGHQHTTVSPTINGQGVHTQSDYYANSTPLRMLFCSLF